MDSTHLLRQVSFMRKSLFDQGYLEEEQFIQLEELEDDANPHFVEEIVTLFYTNSTRLTHNIERILTTAPIDFGKLDNILHQFHGSNSSIGAKKLKEACTKLKEYCSAQDGEGCIRTLQLVKQEYAILRRKLEAYFQMARQIK